MTKCIDGSISACIINVCMHGHMFYYYTHLYSMLWSLVHAYCLQCFTRFGLRHFTYKVSHRYEEDPPPPRLIPCRAYRSASHTLGAVTLNDLHSQPYILHLPHPRQVEVWWLGGHVPMVHVFFSVCLSHRHDCTHPNLLQVGDHSRNLLYAYTTSFSTSGSSTQQGVAWS